MKLLDAFAGFSKSDEALDRVYFNERVEAQRVRVSQSHLSLRLVVVVGLIYIAALWNQVPPLNVIAWIGTCILTAIVRAIACNFVKKSLEQISVATLYRNELWLYFTSIANTTAMGAGYWWVCLGATDRVVFSVTLLSCIYALGTTVNSAMHSRNIPELLISNLGQGVIFLTLFKEPPNFEVAFALVAMIMLLIQFCHRIAELFANSIKMRDENREKNIRLEEQKVIIERALAVAQAANDDKNRFMAATSHDLRQPLHAMTLFLGSLRRSVNNDLSIQLVDKIDEATSILHEQFSSLLDLSKFDAGVIEANVDRGRLDILVRKVADGLLPLAQQKKLALVVDVGPVVIETDILLLERLLRNLMLNAIKFTDSGSIRVTTSVLQGDIQITVSDTGHGIGPEDQEKIFLDYYQVNNRARTKGKGSGLGLAIVKRIAALLEIAVSVKSVLGVGTDFMVTLPTRLVMGATAGTSVREFSVPDPTLIATDAPGDELKGVRVLLLDDDHTILDALAGLICDWGGICHIASSFDEVKSILNSQQYFDLAILDDMLNEETTGLDIATYLAEEMAPERILITTGNTAKKRLLEFKNAGFEVLIKPVDRQHLLSTIRTVLV